MASMAEMAGTFPEHKLVTGNVTVTGILSYEGAPEEAYMEIYAGLYKAVVTDTIPTSQPLQALLVVLPDESFAVTMISESSFQGEGNAKDIADEWSD